LQVGKHDAMTSPILAATGPSMENAIVDILLVDDEVRNLEVLESILASPEYRLVRAQTADEALMALIDGEFAAIVLDIQLPGTSGIELAHLIKQRKRTQHIPIIFLTAYYYEEKEILQGYEVGAVDYLTKPVNPQILKSKIAVFVELFQKTRELVAVNTAMELEITQRQTADEALRQAKNELESRVDERTLELTRAIQDLHAGERRYSHLIESLPAAVYTTDAQGRIALYNEAAVALWGRRPEIGKDLWCGSYRIFRPDGTPLPLEDCPMAVTLKTGRPIRGEEIIIERPDGVRRNVLPYPDPIKDASGKIVGAVNMLLDITENKRTEEVSRRLAAIVESSVDAIISKDLNGIVATWNRGAERLFGFTAAEMVGKPISLLIPSEHANEEPGILERIRRGERLDAYETVRRRKDGSLVEVALTISPIKDALGNIIGASKIARDITGQKQAARELERSHQEAVAASRAKDDFLAALSHELRTPLNPVLLLASAAVENPDLTPELRAQFTTIRNNVELEARLIDDLLDITRIRHGKLSLNLGLVDAHALLREAFEPVRPEFDRKNIALRLQLEAEHFRVKGDAIRLRQVIWNVLRNAVKFTPAGGRVVLTTHPNTETGKLIISISDTGMGMTASELTRAFEAFTQGEHGKGKGSPFGGLGLGLAISRTLMEAHSGTICASSAGRNQGSTFTITLPLATESVGADLASRGDGSRPQVMGARRPDLVKILLVEDHEPTRTVLAQLLTRRRYQVETAASAAEARALAREQAFHLLISDLGLPDGDGLDLMKELQAHNQELQGIALTGYGMEQDIARSLEAGFASHLIKPVSVESLENALARTFVGIAPQGV
jgi:PAS domain S-box-containing protein